VRSSQRLGNGFLESEPCTGTACRIEGLVESIMRNRHPPFVTATLTYKHPETQLALLSLRTTPEASPVPFFAQLNERTCDAGNAVDLATSISDPESALHTLCVASKRGLRIAPIKSEIAEAVGGIDQLALAA